MSQKLNEDQEDKNSTRNWLKFELELLGEGLIGMAFIALSLAVLIALVYLSIQALKRISIEWGELSDSIVVMVSLSLLLAVLAFKFLYLPFITYIIKAYKSRKKK